jgi:hypothetical protein
MSRRAEELLSYADQREPAFALGLRRFDWLTA